MNEKSLFIHYKRIIGIKVLNDMIELYTIYRQLGLDILR